MDSKSDSIAISRDAIQNKTVENTSSYNEEHIIQEHTQFTTLYFESFSITLNQEYNADYLNSNTVITADTIILNASLGTDFNHQYITLHSKDLIQYSIEQSCEASLSIMNEGAHCDLTSWVHAYTDWTSLQANNSGKYMCLVYPEKAFSDFPIVNMDSLKAHVKIHCGAEWVKRIQHLKALNEYPIAIGINRYFFKIKGLYKDGKTKITKLIIIDMPMGC